MRNAIAAVGGPPIFERPLQIVRPVFPEVNKFLAPFQEKYRHYQSAPNEVEDILRDGAARAQAIAHPVLEKARAATGLGHGR